MSDCHRTCEVRRRAGESRRDARAIRMLFLEMQEQATRTSDKNKRQDQITILQSRVCPSACLSVCLSVVLSVDQSICLIACLSLSLSLSVCLCPSRQLHHLAKNNMCPHTHAHTHACTLARIDVCVCGAVFSIVFAGRRVVPKIFNRRTPVHTATTQFKSNSAIPNNFNRRTAVQTNPYP